MAKTKTNRILLKLSGEALMGKDSYGIKLSVVDRIALDIKNLSKGSYVVKIEFLNYLISKKIIVK